MMTASRKTAHVFKISPSIVAAAKGEGVPQSSFISNVLWSVTPTALYAGMYANMFEMGGLHMFVDLNWIIRIFHFIL